MQRMIGSSVVLQQPAAWRDKVITSWSYHDLHERLSKDGFHNIIMVHDLVGHQLTQTVRKTKYLHNIMQPIIAAEITAALQLTDIRGAKMTNVSLHHSKVEDETDARRKSGIITCRSTIQGGTI